MQNNRLKYTWKFNKKKKQMKLLISNEVKNSDFENIGSVCLQIH